MSVLFARYHPRVTRGVFAASSFFLFALCIAVGLMCATGLIKLGFGNYSSFAGVIIAIACNYLVFLKRYGTQCDSFLTFLAGFGTLVGYIGAAFLYGSYLNNSLMTLVVALLIYLLGFGIYNGARSRLYVERYT